MHAHHLHKQTHTTRSFLAEFKVEPDRYAELARICPPFGAIAAQQAASQQGNRERVAPPAPPAPTPAPQRAYRNWGLSEQQLFWPLGWQAQIRSVRQERASWLAAAAGQPQIPRSESAEERQARLAHCRNQFRAARRASSLAAFRRAPARRSVRRVISI